jgi:hypothetical protein
MFIDGYILVMIFIEMTKLSINLKNILLGSISFRTTARKYSPTS